MVVLSQTESKTVDLRRRRQYTTNNLALTQFLNHHHRQVDEFLMTQSYHQETG